MKNCGCFARIKNYSKQCRARVIPLTGEMSVKQTKWCPNSEKFAPAEKEYCKLTDTIKLYFISYRRDRACPCPQKITYQNKFTDSRKGCPYGFYEIKILAKPSLPLTRKVARRRRVGRRESNKQQIFVISPSVKRRAFDSSLVRGSLFLFAIYSLL